MIDSVTKLPVLPFLKWPGGKRWAATRIAEIVDANLRGRYFEPFLGGGAVYFTLRPTKATLSDLNKELVRTYRAVRDDHRQIESRMKRLKVDAATYSRLRIVKPTTQVDTAVRLLYLNRTAFGGLYRLNANGDFNVPYGGGQRTPAILWERKLLARASQVLRGATLKHADFETAIRHSEEGDVIYCDPTYTVAHSTNGFLRYNERVFRWTDQVRLATILEDAVARGVTAIVSNADHESVRALYPAATTVVLERYSAVSRNPALRGPVRELLLVLRPSRRRQQRLTRR